MNKFKIVFALIAVLVILAAPAYAATDAPDTWDEQSGNTRCDRIISETPEQEFVA